MSVSVKTSPTEVKVGKWTARLACVAVICTALSVATVSLAKLRPRVR